MDMNCPDGMPLVFQLTGAQFSEAMLVNAGRAWQDVTAWHRRHPLL